MAICSMWKSWRWRNCSGIALKEVPIRWRDDGDSRLQLLSGNLRNVADIFRIRFSRSEYLREILQCKGTQRRTGP